LALYYEKINQLDLALNYCSQVQISPSSPIYCVSSYQIGVIYLKAGPQFADTAFRYIGAAAKATFFEDGQPSQAKFTTPLRKLGVLSLMGIGTPQNPAAAFSFIQEAAKLGDEPANILLGQMYWMGLGCAVNLSRAMEIFVNYEDNIAAKLSRGLLIMKENPSHACQEFQDVIRHPTTAFDEEHWDVTSIKYEAHVRIAVWEYNGIGGTQKNPARAFHTLKRLSDECNYSGAHYWLAWAYMDGVKLEDGTVIVSMDRDQAFEYFLMGARQGKADCQHRIGMMLREGYSNSMYQKNDAFKFFLEAAKQDYPAALTIVGVCYFSGNGTENGRDLDKAFTYFSAAAKHNEPLAIQYLADYMIKNNSSGPIDRYHIYTELNRSAGVEKDPIAYRMLALVVNSGIDPRETYEEGYKSNHVVYEDLLQLYIQAKKESLVNKSDVKFRFTLHCLWRAIELSDHQSGNYLCNFISKINYDDISKTIETFEKVEGPIPNK
jgi:TPR repeat protein